MGEAAYLEGRDLSKTSSWKLGECVRFKDCGMYIDFPLSLPFLFILSSAALLYLVFFSSLLIKARLSALTKRGNLG